MTDGVLSKIRMSLKQVLKNVPMLKGATRRLNNQCQRDDFVRAQLAALPKGARILDAGCGNQRYRHHCAHLDYRAQDFGGYTTDEKGTLGTDGVGGSTGYTYGHLDYVGDIWAIDEQAGTFDAILCTEVFEHIPYPNEAMAEFARLLKPGGTLILTAPSNCLRHMDPYFFYSGFSDRWYQHVLAENGFETILIEPVGDYYNWLAVEMARTALTHSIIAKLLVAPAFLYFFAKRKTPKSVNTLCEGYHVVARKT